MTVLRHLLPAALLACLAACSGPDLRAFGPACRVETQASLPLTVSRNFLLVPVTLEGRPEMLVVDTGAESTLLTPDTVARLGMAADRARSSVLMGVGGMVRSQNVTARQLQIGDLVSSNQSFGVGAIGLIGDRTMPVAGLLGTDILSHFDVELDVPGRRMVLHAVTGCTGFVPWAGAATAVPVQFNRQGLGFVPVRVDGNPVRALLDSGARASLMTRRVAAAIGVSGAMLEADPVHGGTGIGMASIELRQHHFGLVSLGDITVRDMAVNVADLRLPGVDMLLGADWLASRRIWMSYSGGALFIHR